MKKLVSVLVIAMVLALAFSVAVSAASDTVYSLENGKYNIECTVESDAMYGMVVIEASEALDPTTFELTQADIRYIDQSTAENNVLSFPNVIPMDLKNSDNNYYVYIGGGNYTAVTPIGTLSVDAGPSIPDKVLPTAVALDQTSATLEIDGTVTLTATVTPADAEYTAQWTSSNDAVAEVANGVVTAKSAGTATITVTVANGVTATCEVTVNAPQTPDHMPGDVDGNGSLNVADAVTVCRKIAGHTVAMAYDGDVDGNGSLNVADAVAICRKIAGHSVTIR